MSIVLCFYRLLVMYTSLDDLAGVSGAFSPPVKPVFGLIEL